MENLPSTPGNVVETDFQKSCSQQIVLISSLPP
jgi:hypothetical protein